MKKKKQERHDGAIDAPSQFNISTTSWKRDFRTSSSQEGYGSVPLKEKERRLLGSLRR